MKQESELDQRRGSEEADNKQKANGKTPSGDGFKVPHTNDMLTSIFEPKIRKSTFDMIILIVLGSQMMLFFIIPPSIKRWVFLFLFIFWRAAYNIGLGVLLKYQSDKKGLVLFAKRKIFNKEGRLYTFLKQELSVKMGDDYNFEKVPLEFNTWLLFRQLVDLILLNDFSAYIFFALAHFDIPKESSLIINILRWVGGLFLLWFNIWVKMDAHRVVKDFAWYWGDFFFLVDQSLTFDGVFEMAPHPMYSVGYVGYYGISLMAASYTVLFASLAAHAAQFAFLIFVENPHIDKIYNEPTPLNEKITKFIVSKSQKESSDSDSTSTTGIQTSNFRRDLVVFKNFDLLRSNDIFVVLIILYAVAIPLFIAGASDNIIRIFLITQCVAWRIFHSYGLGCILFYQSREKFLTKHYIKFGGSVSEAFSNWRSIYNLSLCMTYVTFISTAWKMYYFPDDWTYGTVLLRHILGVLLIALHIWTSVSVFEVLGDFGWFYGDFFLDDYPVTLYYTGIYRFLNNPEKIIGHAAFWGITLMSNSWFIFCLALFSHISNVLFLRYVERPHMERLYGDQLRKEAGVTKIIRRANMIPFIDEVSKAHDQFVERIVKEVREAVEIVVEETAEFGEFIEVRLNDMASEMRYFLQNTLNRITGDKDHDLRHYSVSVMPVEDSVNPPQSSDNCDNVKRPILFDIGEPIRIKWTAPKNHSHLDWIAIYKVTSNSSRLITNISSVGRFIYVTPEEDLELDYHSTIASLDDIESGEALFEAERLPWEIGTYEFRYHHDSRYKVMAISQPFEIIVKSPKSAEELPTIEQAILTLVQKALDSDPNLIPHATDDDYTLMKEVHAKRIIYGIKMMFGVDFAWEVVAVDGNVGRLAKRIYDAQRALEIYGSINRHGSKSSNVNIANQHD